MELPHIFVKFKVKKNSPRFRINLISIKTLGQIGLNPDSIPKQNLLLAGNAPSDLLLG